MPRLPTPAMPRPQLPVLCVLLLLAAPPILAEGLPSMKEALASEIHGKSRVKRNRLQLAYDFRDEAQGLDFVLDAGGRFLAFGGMPGTSGEAEHPAVRPGVLEVPVEKQCRLQVPLADIFHVSLRATGIDGISLRLKKDDQQVTVTFGDFPSISFDSGIGIGDAMRRLNILPGKTYTYELLVRNGEAIGKLNGKKVLEKDLPDGFGPLEVFSFGPSLFSDKRAGDYQVTALQLSGLVSEDLPLIAANRGRGEQPLPPVWEQTYTHTGDLVTVHSGVSAEHASTWGTRLTTLVQTVLADLPPSDPPAAPPGSEGDETAAPGADDSERPADQPIDQPGEQPVDRKPEEFSFVRTVYLFQNPRALAAYSGQAQPVVVLDNGDLAVLDDGGEPEDRLRSVCWTLTAQVLGQLYRSVPWWWQTGNCAYYAVNQCQSEGLSDTYLQLVKGTREYLEKGNEPRLSELLWGWTWSRGKNVPSALCWAWMHFLHHADDGQHQGLVRRFHDALRAGKDAEEAGKDVFATAVFNELYPLFESYVTGL